MNCWSISGCVCIYYEEICCIEQEKKIHLGDKVNFLLDFFLWYRFFMV